jgi:3-phenylpropionate/trans-cinnamate dioxygenase ferredoxin reductase component
MVGLSQGYDRLVVRGSLESDSFSAFYLKQGVVISADAVNRPQDFMAARRLVGERAVVPPARLQDEALPLKSLLQAAA